jgi:hypothetical protein
VLDFADWKRGEPMEAVGRFSRVWALEAWMGPHFAVNYPVVLAALDKPVPEKSRDTARMAERMAPPGYALLRLDFERIQGLITRVQLRDDAGCN